MGTDGPGLESQILVVLWPIPKEIVLIQDRIPLGLNTSVELPIRFKIDRPIHRKVDFLLGPGTGKLTGVIAGSQTNRIGSKFLNLRQR